MTVVYLVGNGTSLSYTPRSTNASVVVEIIAAGQPGDGSAGTGTADAGGSGGYAKKNAYSMTIATPVSFQLGAAGAKSTGAASADSWWATTGTVLAAGGGSPTAQVGDVTRAGAAKTLNSSMNGNAPPGGAGAAGPTGAGVASGNLSASNGGNGGSGSNGGTAGAVATTNAGVAGGGSFGGPGGASTTNRSGGQGGRGSGGGGGFGNGTGATGPGGNGGDDFDNGGGGGGSGGFGTATGSGGDGGTPGGGGGGSPNVAGAGGYALIKLTYTSADVDQIIFFGSFINDGWINPQQPPAPRRRSTRQQTGPTLVQTVAAPSTGTTWNPLDLAGPLTLSNGNLTATPTGTASAGVRSTTSKSTGKVYVEFTLPGMVANTSNAVVGIANATETLNSAGQIGASVNSMGFYASNPSQSTYVNVVPLNSFVASVSGTVVVGMAIDFTTSPPTVWITDQTMQGGGLPWNNQATSNPATGTLGTSLTGLAAGPYFAVYNDLNDTPGIVCTANFGASAFTYSVPSGFTAWDPQVTVLADSWFQQQSQPIRRRPVQQQADDGGATLPLTGLVTADRWLQPTNQRASQRATSAQRQTGGVTAPIIVAAGTEIVTLDKWLQQTSQRRSPVRLRQDGDFIFAAMLPIPTPETVTIDKWFQPAGRQRNRLPTVSVMASGFVGLISGTQSARTLRRALVSWLD